MKAVYKIMTLDEWADTSRAGVFLGSALDRKDGYIHLSTDAQVEETAKLHFTNSGLMVLVAVSVESLGAALRFEPSRRGELFPHVYSTLKVEDILWAKQFDSDHPVSLRSLIAE